MALHDPHDPVSRTCCAAVTVTGISPMSVYRRGAASPITSHCAGYVVSPDPIETQPTSLHFLLALQMDVFQSVQAKR